MVYQKSEALSQTNNSSQRTFASKAVKTKGFTVLHTPAPNANKKNEEVMERCESWKS